MTHALIRQAASGRRLAFILPTLLGLLFAGADQFVATKGIFTPYSPTFLLKAVGYIVLFVAVFLVAERLLMVSATHTPAELHDVGGDTDGTSKEGASSEYTPIRPSWPGMKPYLLTTVLAWIPTYLLLFPGVVVGDTSVQLAQYFKGEGFADWHPFLDTYIFGWFVGIGGEQRAMLGVGLYVAVQMILAALTVSYASYYVGRVTGMRKAGYACLLFLAVYPMAPLVFMNMNKDSIFALFFLIFSLMYCEIWRSHGAALKSPAVAVAFVVIMFMTALTKKTGVYLVAFALILMLVMAGRAVWRVMAAVLGVIVTVIVQMLFPTFLFPAIGVTPGPKQEMLAIPEQQIARIVRDHPEEFTAAERQIISDVIAVGFDSIAEHYDDYLVDPIKGTYVPNEQSINSFLKLWAKKAIQHPWSYIATELGLEAGWVSFSGNQSSGNYTFGLPTDSASSNSLTDKIVWPEASKTSIAWASLYNTLAKTPVLNLPMYVCLWASIVPFALAFAVWRRAKHPIDALVGQSPLILSMLMLALCPTSMHARYMQPMMLAAPVFIAIAYYALHHDRGLTAPATRHVRKHI